MPNSDFATEKYHIHSRPLDAAGDCIQFFCAFHSCFRPGFVMHNSDGKYAIYALVKSGRYSSSSGNVIGPGCFVWGRGRSRKPGQCQAELLGDEPLIRKAVMLHKNPFHEALSAHFLPSGNGCIELAEPEKAEMILDQLYDELGLPLPDEAKLAGLFHQLLHEVTSQQQQKLYSPALEKAVLFTAEHLGDPELSRNMIAGHCGVSIRTLSRLFRQELQTSVTQYVIRARLHRICSLLALPGMPLKEIADRCGFRSPVFMTTQFKKHYHCTPKAYRQELFNRK